MGFGLLFIGACLLLPTCFGYFYTAPVAAVFLAIALRRLSRVNTPFGYALYGAVALFILSGVEIVLRLLKLEYATAILDGLCYLALLVIWVLLFTGLEWVAKETDLEPLRGKAFRQKLFSTIYLILLLPLNFLVGVSLPEGVIRLMGSLSVALMWVGLVVHVLNLTTIYSAYMRICMPEDLEMEVRPSPFAFVNRMREERARREAERAEMEAQRAKTSQKSQRTKKK